MMALVCLKKKKKKKKTSSGPVGGCETASYTYTLIGSIATLYLLYASLGLMFEPNGLKCGALLDS